MRRRAYILMGIVVFSLKVVVVKPAYSQGSACAGNSALGCIIPNLYGPQGFVLPNNFHAAHFQAGFQSNFEPFTGAVATELARLPIASPASGFTYTFDSATGVFTRSAQSLGPLLTERAETIGRGKVHVGFAYQRFSFDSLDGIDLGDFPVIFQHEQETGAPYERDFIETSNSIDMTLNQFSLFTTVGVTDRFSVSLAVPIIDMDMSVVSNATIHRIAPANPQFGEAHFFDSANPATSTSKIFRSSGSATGIGDLVFRFKGAVVRGEQSSFSIATDLIAPTGDEHNFLGAGTWGVKPFIAYSVGFGRVTPHLNIGYQINGSSVLSGDISADKKGHLPNQFTYAFGADIGASPRLTLAVDFLGQRVFSASEAVTSTFTPQAPDRDSSGGIQTFASTKFAKNSLNINSISFGGKWNPAGQFLINGNLLIRLNDSGLKAPIVPLIGLSYTF